MSNEIIINALLGGSLIGLSAVFLMLTLGRISGISGITSGLLSLKINKQGLWRGAFLIGLLIGFGSSLGSGCTSGHGVCGIARISPRSLVATGVFLTTAIITVFLSR